MTSTPVAKTHWPPKKGSQITMLQTYKRIQCGQQGTVEIMLLVGPNAIAFRAHFGKRCVIIPESRIIFTLDDKTRREHEEHRVKAD